MKLIKVTPQGYCKGVERAIHIATNVAKEYPEDDIYVLGMLVHNKYVIEALKLHGIKTIEDKTKTRLQLLDEIECGVVIFTAHGVQEAVKKKALAKGLIVIDATCPYVTRTQNLVQKKLSEGYSILYIGKKHHPEAESVCVENQDIYLIETKHDIESLPALTNVFVTNQTTMSMTDVSFLFDAIKEKYPNALFAEELCSATRSRQEAIKNLKHIDALIVVGDKLSNNSNRLAQIGKENGIKHVFLVDDINDIDIKFIQTFANVAVSSGASTPNSLTNQVIQCLQENRSDIQMIDIEKIL